MAEKTSPARQAAFFAALAETGNQAIAAERAKVSRSWVTLHRMNDPEFRARIEAALAQARARLRANAGGVRPPRGWGSLDGEELVVRSGNGRRVQIARAHLKRWTPRAEARFLATLAATCNVRAACAEVGLSAASAYRHAARWDGFAERWKMAVAEGYLRIEVQLLARATGTLSPGDTDALGGDAPSDDALFQQLYMHRPSVRAVGKMPGRRARPRLAAREEMMVALNRALDRVERGKRAATTVDADVRARDSREWARRDRGGRSDG